MINCIPLWKIVWRLQGNVNELHYYIEHIDVRVLYIYYWKLLLNGTNTLVT
jgi:hypothetical protein